MAQLFKSTFLILTALFPIVNPLGSAPLFLSLTHYYSADERKMLSRRIALNSIALIVILYFIGTHILAFFGISLPVVHVGGGLVLASTGWAMLKQKDEDSTKADVHRSVGAQDLLIKAFYPLTLPLTSVFLPAGVHRRADHLERPFNASQIRALTSLRVRAYFQLGNALLPSSTSAAHAPK